jgi:hypothetical protein
MVQIFWRKFSAELHHLGTYISQPITLKHGVINEKITNVHHCKNLYSCVYTIVSSSRTKWRVQRKKPYVIIYISTLKGTLIEYLMLLYQIGDSIMVTIYPLKTPVTFWTICVSIFDTPQSFDSWPLKNGPIGFPKMSVRKHHYIQHNIPEKRSSQVWTMSGFQNCRAQFRNYTETWLSKCWTQPNRQPLVWPYDITLRLISDYAF